MSETDETNKLLREILDVLVRREEMYQQYLKETKENSANHVNDWRRMVRGWAIVYWVATFAIVYFAVVLAMSAN